MLQIGIIGCGRVTTMFHLKAISNLDEVSLVALSDVDGARLKEVARKTGVRRTFLDYQEMLDEPYLNSVAVNTPPGLHSQIVLDALLKGKHVLCEKPLAQEIDHLYRIKHVSDERDLVVVPVHNYAFSPCLELAKTSSFRLGKIVSMEVCFKNNLNSYNSKTRFRTGSNTGIIEDLFPHILSVIIALVGYPVDVTDTRWWCSKRDVCDNLETSLVTSDGVPVSCKVSWTSLIPRFKIRIRGTEGFLETDLMWKPYEIRIKTDTVSGVYSKRGLGWYLDLLRLRHPSFRNQYIHFERVVKGCESPMITIDDELAMINVMKKVSECFEASKAS